MTTTGDVENAGIRQRLMDEFEQNVIHPIEDFQNPKQEWRRLFSELLGTFFLCWSRPVAG
jgi:aquaporin Z